MRTQKRLPHPTPACLPHCYGFAVALTGTSAHQTSRCSAEGMPRCLASDSTAVARVRRTQLGQAPAGSLVAAVGRHPCGTFVPQELLCRAAMDCCPWGCIYRLGAGLLGRPRDRLRQLRSGLPWERCVLRSTMEVAPVSPQQQVLHLGKCWAGSVQLCLFLASSLVSVYGLGCPCLATGHPALPGNLKHLQLAYHDIERCRLKVGCLCREHQYRYRAGQGTTRSCTVSASFIRTEPRVIHT